MERSRICPKCGAKLESDAMEGLCPKCVAQVVFGGDAEAKPAATAATTIRVEPGNDAEIQHPGAMIGRYKLLEKVGEGGFGLVYMAEQVEPVQRKVALKVIKAGMDTKEVIARFEAERQALALMDHPNIARVLDAGATQAGRPYFVMELVKGVPITEFCDLKKLSPAERLQLFMKVCQAVQHAHQKGIIHRDIKPSNVLVTLHDGEPVPKVIDFGIAKALGPKLTEKTLFTGFAQLLGTPAYMSPEQAELSGLDIDTRSDIYSLGVLLYELLTGVTPFEREALAKAALDEIRRMIRETEPPKPSTRLQTMGEKLTEVANRRGTEPAALSRLVRGDLDWIVMKCLEKDRKRRYETANGLVMDLQRHLHHEPVTAAAPGAAYRAKKFVARNKAALSVAGSMVLLLLAGTIVSTWQAVRATRAERQAKAEASKSTEVAQFLKDMLEGVGPSVAKGRDTTMLREILDKTAERVGKELQSEPEVEEEVLNTIGLVYQELGEYKQAEAIFRRVLERATEQHGSADSGVAKHLDNLALTFWYQGKWAEAESALREALAIQRKQFPGDHEDVALTLNNLANVLGDQDKLAEAEALSQESLEMTRRLQGDNNLKVAASVNAAATLLQRQGKLSEAEPLFREVLATFEARLGAEHAHTIVAINNLALLLQERGKYPESEELNRRGLALARKLYAGEHSEIAASLNNLGNLLCVIGRMEEAATTHQEALAMRRKLWGPKHPDVSESLDNLGRTLFALGRYSEAEVLHREALALGRELIGAEHPKVALSLNNLAAAVFRQERRPEAISLWREVLVMQRGMPRTHPGELALTLNNLATALLMEDKLDEALTLNQESLAIRRELYGNDHEALAYSLSLQSHVLRKQNKLTEAEAVAREALAMRRKLFGQENPDVARSLMDLGLILQSQGKLTDAETVLREALEMRRKLLSEEHSEVASSLRDLVSLLENQGKRVEIEGLYRERLQRLRTRLPADDPRIADTLSGLTRILLIEEKFVEAEPVARECLELRRKSRPDNWQTFDSASQLGGSLLGQKRFAEAEPVLRSAYEGMKQQEAMIPASSNARLREALERLVQLYEATGQSEKITEWKTELAKFDSASPASKPAAPKQP